MISKKKPYKGDLRKEQKTIAEEFNKRCVIIDNNLANKIQNTSNFNIKTNLIGQSMYLVESLQHHQKKESKQKS